MFDVILIVGGILLLGVIVLVLRIAFPWTEAEQIESRIKKKEQQLSRMNYSNKINEITHAFGQEDSTTRLAVFDDGKFVYKSQGPATEHVYVETHAGELVYEEGRGVGILKYAPGVWEQGLENHARETKQALKNKEIQRAKSRLSELGDKA